MRGETRVRASLLALAALGSVGCATARGTPSELLDARAAVALARASATARRCPDELGVAVQALEIAESIQRTRPGTREVRDRAYVARRLAERARVAGLYNADLEALESARRAVLRTQRNLQQQEERAHAAALARARVEALRARARAAIARAFEHAAGQGGEVLDTEHSISVRFPGRALFDVGLARLAWRAEPRLDALALALSVAHPSRVTLRVVSDDPGSRGGAGWLASQRAKQIRAALVRRGARGILFEIETAVGEPTVELVISAREELGWADAAPQTAGETSSPY